MKTKNYTIAVRERDTTKSRHWLYIGQDGKARDTTLNCRPLTREQAQLAKRLLVESAAKAGRPIECRVVNFTYGA